MVNMSTSVPTIAPRITVPIAQIRVGERIRTDFGDLDELIETFKENEASGKPRLIQPIVVDRDFTLIDGGRRLEAHIQAGYTDVDVAFYECMDEGERMRLEVDANKHKRFNWLEQCLAVARYHNYYSTKAALASKEWGVRETGSMLGMGKSPVNYCVMLAKYIQANDEEIIKCESMRDALTVLLNRKEKEAQKQLVQKTIRSSPTGEALLSVDLSKSKVPVMSKPAVVSDDDDGFFSAAPAAQSGQFSTGVGSISSVDETPGGSRSSEPTIVPLSSMLFHSDCLVWMKDHPESVDHIITDIPYGIDMDMLNHNNPHGGMKDIDSVRKEHDVDDNIELFKQFFPRAYATLKPSGYLITWMDVMHWNLMYDLAIKAGFKVQRWPLTWHKTHTCMNQAANVNFTKNTEIALVCRKGSATLIRPQSSSVWSGSNDTETRLLGHPFVKPAGLWTWLFDAVCIRGNTVLDPFAGVGSSTVAAVKYGLRPITCEINEDHYNRQVSNVQNVYLSLDSNIKFS